MAEGQEQVIATIFDVTPTQRGQIQADWNEGIGLVLPERSPEHADPDWFQCDLDDPIVDPDAPFVDPLRTERHYRIPD